MNSTGKLLDALESQEVLDIQEEIMIESAITHADSRALARELYRRGFTIRDVFGVYYELEEQASALTDETMGSDEEGQHGARSTMTLEDAKLAGLA